MSQSARVLESSRREALFVAVVWVLCCLYTCGYAAFNAYSKSPKLFLILGMPSWVFWGIIFPWGVCTIVTCYFALWGIQDTDLGDDEADAAGGEHA